MARKAKTPPLVNNKYICIKDEIKGLYQVRLIRDIGNQDDFLWVQSGTYGGYITEDGQIGTDDNDYSWLEENCTLIKSTIRDKVYVGGHAYIENSTIIDKCHVYDNAKIYNCKLSGSVTVSADAYLKDCVISGNNINIAGKSKLIGVTITGNNITFKKNAQIIAHDNNIIINHDNITITTNYNMNMLPLLYNRYGMYNDDGYFTMYKLVQSTDIDKVYKSFHDEYFIYDLQNPKLNTFEIAKTKSVNFGRCAEGFHLCFKNDPESFSWMGEDYNKCDIILTCLVKPSDLRGISYTSNNNHKARAKKIKVIKAQKWPLEPEIILPSTTITHGMNTTYLIPMVYDVNTNEVVYNYSIKSYNYNAVTFTFEDEEGTKLNEKYKFTLLTPKKTSNKVIPPVTRYKMTMIGNGKNSQTNVNHNLNTKYFIPSVYTKDPDNNDIMIDKTRDCKFILTDDNNMLIKFDKKLKTNEEYYISLIKPPTPLMGNDIGKIDSGGLVNCTSDWINIKFMGSDLDEETNSIILKHNKNTYDIYGTIYDWDDNTYHLFDFDTLRLDKNTIKLIINFNYFKNHIFDYFMCY